MAITTTRKHSARKTHHKIDYPAAGELIQAPQYTLRISAPESVRAVEVSIDDGDWQPCRQSVGHWWYDWSGYEDGEHEIVSRIQLQDGSMINSEPHGFIVELAPDGRPS